jgi:lysine/ornithine N-monooxygenase
MVMTQGYFWQVPELTKFRTVFENADVVLGASISNQQRLFRKDTGRICFDEQEAKRLCVNSIMREEATLFRKEKNMKSTVKRITIIGSGASGTLLAANLLRSEANCSLEINLVDKKEKIGRGVAYSTTSDCHLLNVPAAKMSAFADDMEHFYRWLKENDYDYQPSDFVPRKIYGKYLRDVISQSILNINSNAQINVIDDEAVDIVDDKFGTQVILKSGEILFSDQVILAFGNFAPPLPPVSDLSFAKSEKYFQNS